jgi:hypothetical protein
LNSLAYLNNFRNIAIKEHSQKSKKQAIKPKQKCSTKKKKETNTKRRIEKIHIFEGTRKRDITRDSPRGKQGRGNGLLPAQGFRKNVGGTKQSKRKHQKQSRKKGLIQKTRLTDSYALYETGQANIVIP